MRGSFAFFPENITAIFHPLYCIGALPQAK
jgi:hypothetical protein